ncbi:MAG: nucleotidyltransferase family protein [Desulfobaccales bacterium]|nr:nucleotidyltransferase family protein [Desulfobaccales bacterium]
MKNQAPSRKRPPKTLLGMPPILKDLLPLMLGVFSGEARAILPLSQSPFGEFLRQSRLTPWLYRQVTQHGWEDYLTTDLLKDLRQDYILELMAASRQEQEIYKVIGALVQAGITLILLKGADLRLRLYGDPAVRPMRDLDLLIAFEDLDRAQQALIDLGYRIYPTYKELRPGFRQRAGNAIHYVPPPDSHLLVDLHWEIAVILDFYRLPYAFLRQKAIPLQYQGLPVYVLSPEHTLIHLCLHLYHHFPLVTQTLDLALALVSLPVDWAKFLKEAARFKCQRPVYLMLQEVAPLLPQAPPPEVMASLARYRPSFMERAVLHRRLGSLTLGIPWGRKTGA